MCPEGKQAVSTHSHFQYISADYLSRFKNLCANAEVFKFLHKKYPFCHCIWP